MDGTQDLSKIIGIIMENPDIIEKIKALADKPEASPITKSEPISVAEEKPVAEAVSAAPAADRSAVKKRRHELLSALKPYVKSERARAIDTMLSVIDVIDVMKVR